MKNIQYIIVFTLALMVAACGDYDSYDAPDGSIFGNVIDPLTGENIQTSFDDDDVKLRIIELNEKYPNPLPQDLHIKQDGSFRNDFIFSGKYAATIYGGAFTPGDTVLVNTSENNGFFEIEATPHFRISLTMPEVISDTLDYMYSYRITRDSGFDEDIKEIIFIRARWQVADYDVGNRSSLSVDDTDAYINATQDSTQLATLPSQGPGTYWFRVGVAAEGSNYYNYSELQEVYLDSAMFVVDTTAVIN